VVTPRKTRFVSSLATALAIADFLHMAHKAGSDA
jgi:hypothetical protein